MALLDRDGVYGSPRFHLAAKKNGIKAHIGAEITVQSPKSKVQSPAIWSNLQRQKTSQPSGLWTLDFGLWTKNSAHQKKRSRFRSWFEIVRVIKIFAG